jgi:phenylacetate-CoA ligase
MPFIRYAIGDVGALADPDARCPCGRGLPLLSHVSGRSSDQLTLPSGRQLLMWYFTDVFRQTPGIDSFQMRQQAPDHIVIRVVPGSGFGHLPGGPAGHGGQGTHTLGAYVGPEGIVEDLRRRCNEQIRDEARLDIVLVDSIPSGPGGKRRFFIADASTSASPLPTTAAAGKDTQGSV